MEATGIYTDNIGLEEQERPKCPCHSTGTVKRSRSNKQGLTTRTWKQPRYPSADEWIRKLWYMYTMEYYSAIKKNAFESILMRWMKLEPIIQSEVSQKDKDQYSILTHIYGIQKDGNDNPICKTEKETQMYRTDFWTLWERARVGWSERTALKHVHYHM